MKHARAALLACILAIAAPALATPALAQEASKPFAPGSGVNAMSQPLPALREPLDERSAREVLRSRGYSDIGTLTQEGTVYKGRAMIGGRFGTVAVDSTTGAITFRQ